MMGYARYCVVTLTHVRNVHENNDSSIMVVNEHENIDNTNINHDDNTLNYIDSNSN